MYKFLIFLIALYITLLLVATLLVHKLTIVLGFTISASTFIFPFTYTIGDVVAEVYGYKVSRQMIWAAFISIFIFDMCSPLLAHLPAPTFWHLQNSYNVVLDSLPRVFMGDFIAINIGAFLNIYFISRWKILTHGQYFWLRSIGSTILGEAIFNILAFFIIFIGFMPLHAIIQAMSISYLFKIAFAFFMAYPASLLVSFLKNIEKVDNYDYSTNFNPFKLD
ncbi:MAG: conserved hypothetical integral rane protein [Gammaproteobacteria bacterium]|jgi:uncharacterized integral membrane protein (TIGR00697 family)|nr:conserved hypothetical integral rane protein [Gammaproteobacteria bacterium]